MFFDLVLDRTGSLNFRPRGFKGYCSEELKVSECAESKETRQGKALARESFPVLSCCCS